MGFAEGFAAGTDRKIRSEQLKLVKQQQQEELAKQGYSFDANGNMSIRPDSQAEAEQAQYREAAQLSRALQGKLAAQDSDRAFEDFAATGDASYLQRALDNNKYLKDSWLQRGVQLITNLDFENDSKLLDNAGIKQTFYDTQEKKDIIRKNTYKYYDGKDWKVGLLNNAVMETGTATRLGPRRSAELSNNHEQLVSLLSGPKVSPYTAEGHKYEKEINAAADKYNLPHNLIASMIKQESGSNPKAVSNKGATGLMQLMPDTASELGVTDPTDPMQNIDGGAKYMRQLLDKYNGDIKLALAAYNAGPGNVDKYNGIPPFSETQNYVSSILGNLDTGEKYYNRTADDVTNTILSHYRDIANAKSGLSTEMRQAELDNTTRALDIKQQEANLMSDANDTKRMEILAKLKTEGTTATQKDLNAAAKTTEDMLASWGGEDKFFATDFTDSKNFNKAYKDIVKIESLEGTKLTADDKKAITDVRELLSLTGPASKLTEAQTGLLDSTLSSAMKYATEEVGGTAATSAYNAFRNSVRNALYGATLSPTEVEAFNSAFGTLGQKAGPVLQQFITGLAQVKAKLESTKQLGNPYSMHVRLGGDVKKLDKAIEEIDKRIMYYQGLDPANTMTQEQKSKRKPLNEIFGG